MKSFADQHARACVLEYKSAPLSSDFGMQLFMKKAGDDAAKILEGFGVYQRGPKKGKQKGFIQWIKVVEGGFDYSRFRRGVLRGGCIEFKASKDFVEHWNCEYNLTGVNYKEQTEKRNKELLERISELERSLETNKKLLTHFEKENDQEMIGFTLEDIKEDQFLIERCKKQLK